MKNSLARITAAAALAASLAAAGPAFGQAVAPGFTPETPLPKVELPPRRATSPSAVPAPSVLPIEPPHARPGVSAPSEATAREDGSSASAAAARALARQRARAVTTPEQSNYEAGMVLEGRGRAYDGHSLLVGDAPVRLNGVEAPAVGQTCETPSGTAWRCGRRAYARLADLVDGRKVTCVVSGPAGAGAAAVCSASGTTDVGRFMVAEGMAIPNNRSRGAYALEALEARRARKGLWVGAFENPAEWRARNP